MNSLLEALAVLNANRLRTSLALLGLMVGVAAVIAIQVLGHAMSGALGGVLKVISPLTFIAYPDNQNSGPNPESMIPLAALPQLESLPGVRIAIPYSQYPATAILAHKTAMLQVAPSGGDPGFLPQPLADGEALTQADVDGRSNACIVSDRAVQKLQTQRDELLGEQLRLGTFHCHVVGVLKPAPTGALNFDFSPDVLVPYTTFIRQYFRGMTKTGAIQVLATDNASLSSAEKAVERFLGDRTNGKSKYRTFDPGSITGLVDKVFGVVSIVVGAIGSISLVVAGIGIMNVLLVSIAERTREIGVRKAIGARRGQILVQFFLEASLLSFTGCALGAVLGLSFAAYVNAHYIVRISGVIVGLPWVAAAALAIAFATIVTLAFGTYPAYRAAALDPIEALRYE